MDLAQPGILAEIPALARHLTFELAPDEDPGPALHDLAGLVDGTDTVVGIGASVALALDREIPGLRTFPPHAAPGLDVPSTPAALWCWLRGDDRGELVHRTRQIEAVLDPALRPEEIVDSFRYGSGLDLTGYEDGTENPVGEAALEAAVVRGAGPGLDGGSFVAVQRWIHDLGHFQSMAPETRDHVIGRRSRDNEELDDAPESAHVKRTAQESFTPEAFLVRRSMPWADSTGEGLVFVAFGRSFDAYEAILTRMVGKEDGVTDALFRFTRPATGAYFWCPPAGDGRLDLSALGL